MAWPADGYSSHGKTAWTHDDHRHHLGPCDLLEFFSLSTPIGPVPLLIQVLSDIAGFASKVRSFPLTIDQPGRTDYLYLALA